MKFIRYLFVGGTTAIIQFSTLAITLHWLHFRTLIAASTAYVSAVFFHYFTNRYFTFQMTGQPNFKEIARYLTIVLMNFIVTLGITKFSIENLHVSPYIGTFLSILATVGIGFLLAGNWIFANTKGEYE